MAASSLVKLKISGHVQEWPPGFTATLPADHWLAVLAAPRQDKILCATMRYHRIPGLMFYERRTRTYRRKGTQEFLVPLLGAWAFIHTIDHELVWSTERVVRILPIRRADLFVRELGDLIALLRGVQTPPVVNPTLVAGVRVRVVRGGMTGLCGMVVRRCDHARLVVNLTALGTSVSVELPADAAVEAVDETTPASIPAEIHLASPTLAPW